MLLHQIHMLGEENIRTTWSREWPTTKCLPVTSLPRKSKTERGIILVKNFSSNPLDGLSLLQSSCMTFTESISPWFGVKTINIPVNGGTIVYGISLEISLQKYNLLWTYLVHIDNPNNITNPHTTQINSEGWTSNIFYGELMSNPCQCFCKDIHNLEIHQHMEVVVWSSYASQIEWQDLL